MNKSTEFIFSLQRYDFTETKLWPSTIATGVFTVEDGVHTAFRYGSPEKALKRALEARLKNTEIMGKG